MEWKRHDDKKTALMFLVDGCAVLHFIHLDGIEKLNELGFKNDLLAFTKHDLFLLENQLPYKLLELLMGCCSTERAGDSRKSVMKFIDNNAMSLIGANRKEKEIPEKPKEEHHHHLLGMLRKRLIREESKNEDSRGTINRFCHKILDRCFFDPKKKLHGHTYGHTFRNILEIKQKGIMFGTSDTGSLKDISLRCEIHNFCMATRRLPSMIVDDSTGPKFMNLIAYEMCPHFQNDFEITSYVSFLDSLIDKEEDVRELRDAGVLHNGLGSDQDVADLFNNISKNLVPNPVAYLQVKRRIQEHCNSVWATEGAQLYYTYFSSPWSFLAFTGALLGLGLTAAQAYDDYILNH